MNRQTVIVSGGSLDEELTLSFLKDEKTEYVIAVDKGLEFFYEHQLQPDYIVGDFDSLPSEILEHFKLQKEIPIREFNPVKDATDTEIAIRLAIEKGKMNLVILGATGTRLDHVWGNVQTLKIAVESGCNAVILDRHNRIRLIQGETLLSKADAFGQYFSLFPLGGTVRGLTITGAKYPLTNHTLEPYDSLCVSNQIAEEEAVIAFDEGLIVLIESCD